MHRCLRIEKRIAQQNDLLEALHVDLQLRMYYLDVHLPGHNPPTQEQVRAWIRLAKGKGMEGAP
jgi:hypothetical protein